MKAIRGRLWALLALCGACGAQPPAAAEVTAQEAPCEPPLERKWLGPIEYGPSLLPPPTCEGVTFDLSEAGRLFLVVDGERLYESDAADAVAFRDAEGVGMVTADWSGRYYLHLPGRSGRILVGHAPVSWQWGLGGVYVAPDGWWIWTWATWAGEHRMLRRPQVDMVFVPRSTLEPVAIAWPLVDDVPLETVHVEGGLKVTVDRGERGLWGLDVRWVPGCAPPSGKLVEPPPRCASYLLGMCFGRC